MWYGLSDTKVVKTYNDLYTIGGTRELNSSYNSLMSLIKVFFVILIIGFCFLTTKKMWMQKFTHLIAQSDATARQPINSASSPIIIKDLGSTNLPGWILVIQQDGSGQLNYLQNISFPPKTFNKLVDIVNKVGDVSKIPSGNCVKSASFGSITTIEFHGVSSGDMQCVSDEASQLQKDLGLEIQIISRRKLGPDPKNL